MSNLKSLVKDTAIYGLSSIVGRFLNYLLTPLYTIKLASASGEYGIMTNMYAITALILVILTFGLRPPFLGLPTSRGKMRIVCIPLRLLPWEQELWVSSC